VSESRNGPGRRVTIRDVAELAGVSNGAVSLAIHNQPGVSEATRARIKAAAQQLGWRPNQAAQVMRGMQQETVGLVIPRGSRAMGLEPFWMQFIAGIESVLVEHGCALKLCLAPDQEREIEVHSSWWRRKEVGGAIVVDLRVADERVPILKELGMPVVMAAHPSLVDGLRAVWTDDTGAMETLVRYLAALGHRAIARVGGNPALGHTALRTEAFERMTAELGLRSTAVTTGDSGSEATRTLLLDPQRPTAVIYDNTIMAVAALAVSAEMGFDVPGDLSVVAWDDSPLCRVTTPPLSVVRHDVYEYGARAATALIRLIDGMPQSPDETVVPVIHPRGSTAAPPR
jgi:DNA-binding LacI/PurR family transcriptional regulator